MIPESLPERRSVPRVLSKQIIEIRQTASNHSRTAISRDVSPRAVYLYTDEAVPEGQPVEIRCLDLQIEGVHGAPAKHLGKVLRIDCIEAGRKYGMAISIDGDEPLSMNHIEDAALPAGYSLVSLRSKAVASLNQRDVRLGLVALAVIIAAGLATSFIVGALRNRESLAAEQRLQHGRDAIKAGKPDAAATDFGAVLALAPGRADVRLQLARALLAAGKLDEAKRCYLALRQAEPNSGPINLELARLEARSGEAVETQRYYRAAIGGFWPADAILSRQRTRIELARYLVSSGALGDARAELLVLAENPPDDLALLKETASLLTSVGDFEHALTVYKGVLAITPHDKSVLVEAGTAAYALGQYVTAQRLLTQIGPASGQSAEPEFTAVKTTLESINAILSTFPAPGLPPGERADRVLRAWDTVTRRLASCAKISLGSMLYAQTEIEIPRVTGAFAPLYSRWRDIHTRMKTSQQRWELRRDPELQSEIMSVAYEIEQQTAQSCGAPTGTDQALLRMAQHPEGIQR